VRLGSRAGDAREQHSGNKCLGGQVRGSHRGMVKRPEAGCEPEEKAWEIPGIFRTFGALCAGTGLGVKPKCGAGVDFTVHGGGPRESGGHQERCRGCDILGASDSGGLERVAHGSCRVADGGDNRCPEI